MAQKLVKQQQDLRTEMQVFAAGSTTPKMSIFFKNPGFTSKISGKQQDGDETKEEGSGIWSKIG